MSRFFLLQHSATVLCRRVLARHFVVAPSTAELWSVDEGGRRAVAPAADAVTAEGGWYAIRADRSAHYVVVNHGDRLTVAKTRAAAGARATVEIKCEVDGALVGESEAALCDACYDKGDFTMHGVGEMGACSFIPDSRLCGDCDGDHENHCFCRD